jgi:(R,R)-butanediol dehydrogenase/meso-butanediol dehydrogenase/diacetyl reductase
MQAIRFHGPNDIRLENAKYPSVTASDQVRIKIGAAGICGSDLHVYKTGAYVTQIPVIMGHEFAGTILEVGKGVRTFSPGDKVVADSKVICGHCAYCDQGESNLCEEIGFLGEVRDGAFAEEIVIEESSLVKISQDVPFHLAALAEPLAVAIHALSKTKMEQHSKALVIGSGPIGALIHCLLRVKGFKQVQISDISEYRRQVIEKAYSGSVVDPQEPYDLVFETTGSASVVKKVLPNVLENKCTLVMVGLFDNEVPFDFTQLVEKEWNVCGCAAFSSELKDAAAILEKHWHKFEHIVSHHLQFSDFQLAFDTLLDPRKEAMKIVFMPN